MSDSFKSALWTALFTFIFTVSTALLGLLAAITEWINGNDPTLVDDISNFGKIALAAIVAAGSGLVNWLVRSLQARGALPGNGPTYTKSE
jgi:hypothetical protein